MGDVRIALPNPCIEPWEAMSPHGCNRHCATCDKIIHDLSALRLAEVEALLVGGEEVCVRARIGRDGVVELADSMHGSRRVIAAVGVSMALATTSCQTVPTEGRLDRFEIRGTLPMVQNGKPVVRSSDGQSWHVEMAYRSTSFRVPDLYPGVYSITYDASCGEARQVQEDIVIRDRSIDLGQLEGEGDCIIVGVMVPVDQGRSG